MVIKKGRKTTNKKKIEPITRRQFLKETGLVVGGAAIVSLGFYSACSSPESKTTPNTETITTDTKEKTTVYTTTSLQPAEGFVYVTPTEPPPKIPIPGCITNTATDRMYTIEHMWAKLVAQNIVAIGITEKMSELIGDIYKLYLPKEGRILQKDGYLGSADASKINVEFVSPVSGTVLQINDDIWSDLVATINDDPYVSGWMFTVQLSNPEEYDALLTPQDYTDLNTKIVDH
jgi:glycine cleavage system H protein